MGSLMPVGKLRVWCRTPQGKVVEGRYLFPLVRIADGFKKTLFESRFLALLRIRLKEAPSHYEMKVFIY